MPFENPVNSITLPADATDGARIVLDGDTNVIQVISENGASITLDPNEIISLNPLNDGSVRIEFSVPNVSPLFDGGVSGGIRNADTELFTIVAAPTDDTTTVPVNSAFIELVKTIGGSREIALVSDLITFIGALSASGAFNSTNVFGSARALTTDACFAARVSGDAMSRVFIRADGRILWGSGAAAQDTRIYRSAAGVLAAHDIKFNLASNVAESWHPFVYQNGWADSGGAQVTAQYRRIPSPANCVQIVGESTTGTFADGTVIANLPAGYRPTSVVSFPVAANPVPAGTTTPLLQVLQNGDITCYGMTVATNIIYFSAIIPLDAI